MIVERVASAMHRLFNATALEEHDAVMQWRRAWASVADAQAIEQLNEQWESDFGR
jgi:hypothetical protein